MEKILIVYSKTENVVHSFWKYFFQSCGVWVKSCDLEKDQIEENHYKKLFILDYMNADILDDICLQDVYIVKKNSTFKKYMKNNNVCVFDWKRIETADKIIELIFENGAFMIQLLKYYISNNLWRDAWLYHEVAHTRNHMWDKSIINDCENTIKALRSLNDNYDVEYEYYKQYMILYCEFLNLGSQRLNVVDNEVRNTGLLKDIEELSNKYECTLALLMLKAKTCSLSSITNMRTVQYLEKIREEECSANILYDIGRQYGEVYGNWKLAYEYYERAVKCNKNYFRALYQKARQEERKEKWVEAIRIYVDVIGLLPRKREDSFASMGEVEYLYKSIRNIEKISLQNLNNSFMGEAMHRNLERVKTEVDKKFGKLIHCMSRVNNSKETKEIFQVVVNEIKERIL